MWQFVSSNARLALLIQLFHAILTRLWVQLIGCLPTFPRRYLYRRGLRCDYASMEVMPDSYRIKPHGFLLGCSNGKVPGSTMLTGDANNWEQHRLGQNEAGYTASSSSLRLQRLFTSLGPAPSAYSRGGTPPWRGIGRLPICTLLWVSIPTFFYTIFGIVWCRNLKLIFLVQNIHIYIYIYFLALNCR